MTESLLNYSKTFLQNGDKNNLSLYDHLSELLLQFAVFLFF